MTPMPWYVAAAIAGVLMPWLVMGATIRTAFEEGGLQRGLGTWSGMCILTVPAALIFFWLGMTLLRSVH